jgi:CRP-like cAMP-binding protein
MQLEHDIDKLLQQPLFNGLDREQLSMIAFSAERLLFRHGDPLTKDGQLGQAAYILLSGAAEIVEGSGKRQHIRLVGPGAMIGELAMLVEYTHPSTAIAIEETEVLELRRDLIHDMMKQFPDFSDQLSDKMTARLSKMATEMRDAEGQRWHDAIEVVAGMGVA